MRKLGIYVQVRFCQTKCTYCNFDTGVVASSWFAPYVEAVCGEIRGHRELLRTAGVGCGAAMLEKAHSQEWLCHEAVVDTVYIGGGTPSLLDPAHLQSILDAIRETFNGNGEGEDCGGQKNGGPSGLRASEPPHSQEVTLEADPETIEAEKVAAWVQAGINRGSFGLQSFVDKELVAAGGVHPRGADFTGRVWFSRGGGTRL